MRLDADKVSPCTDKSKNNPSQTMNTKYLHAYVHMIKVCITEHFIPTKNFNTVRFHVAVD